jgi:hypothetical protein
MDDLSGEVSTVKSDPEGPVKRPKNRRGARAKQEDQSTELPEEVQPDDQNRSQDVLSSLFENQEIPFDIVEGSDAGQRIVRPKFIDRRTKRRVEIEPPRVKKVFDPQPVVELLRGRYRAVWREMRRTLSEALRFVHRYEPDETACRIEDPEVDFESMMREAVEEFEREGREVDDDRAPS